MHRIAVVLVSASLAAVAFCNGDENAKSEDGPTVQTSFGKVKGYTFTSTWTNRTIHAFHGIPYAAPPVGDLRFRDPVPPAPWDSIKDCTEDQNSCMQSKTALFNKFDFLFGMSEDCLYLNVYTPQLSPEGGQFPVMVWLHGGGFLEGSGSSLRYGPDLLVAEGVVVVSINYRLGAFGFLTLGNSEVPGNAGLKDQRLAFQWVQKEISNFGGDPGRVTLFGQSAGSSSIHFHYLSPLSKGLFQRAIGESGTALNWAFRENGTAYSLNFASALGCHKHGLAAAPACLRNVSAEAILLAHQLVRPSAQDMDEGVGLVFTPCVDKGSDQPLLPDPPMTLIEQDQGSHVPFMMGINQDEGMMALVVNTEDRVKKVLNYLGNYIHKEEPRSTDWDSKLETLIQRLKSFYFKDQKSYWDLIRGYINLYTDFSFGYTTAESAKAFRRRNDVYLYDFAFLGPFKEQMFKEIEEKYNVSGVPHGEEMNYLFVRKKVNQTGKVDDSREVNTWKRMVRLWTNFAKFGTPTVGADPLLQNVSWSPVDQRSTRYLRIDDDLTMETSDFFSAAVALWDSVIPSTGYLNISGIHDNQPKCTEESCNYV